MRAAIVVLLPICLLTGCGRDDPDVEVSAAALCVLLQDWIDDVEQTSKQLSDGATALDDGAGRRRHFEVWADAVLARTRELRAEVEGLDLPAPLPGLDDGVEILEAERARVGELPDPDPERLAYRVAQSFLTMENVFAKTRTSVERLGTAAEDERLTRALAEEPACRDYNDPLT